MKPILISYSRLDNVTVEQDLGWVSQFRRALEAEMGHISRPTDVWMDIRDIEGNRVFDEQIEHALDESKVLVIILTKNWIKSKYCRDELMYFLNKADAKDRIFLVHKSVVPHQDRPAELDKLNGYRFHQAVNEKKPDVLLELDVTEKADSDFRQNLRHLSFEIEKKLDCEIEEITEEPEQERTKPWPDPKSHGRKILLARASPDLLGFGEELYKELTAQNHEIIELKNYRGTQQEVVSELNELIGYADTSLQLIGKTSDALLETQFDTLNKTSEINCLTWISPEASSKNSENSELAARIADAQHGENDRLFGGIAEAAKVDIINFLAPKKPIEVDNKAELYLVYSREDSVAATEIAKYLTDKGVRFIPSLFEGDPTALTSYHIEQIKSAGNLMVYWGRSHDVWCYQKTMDLQKYAPSSSPARRKKLFCLGDPQNPQKQTITLSRLVDDFDEVIELFSDKGFELLDPHISDLKRPV